MTARGLGWLLVLVFASCWRSKPPPRTSPPEPVRIVKARPPAPSGEFYALDEALADAFSGAWTFVGTGEWFGMFRVNACVYRNERVYIVDKYCTLKEKRAFGVVIMSPTRGWVHLYAEGDKVPTASRYADWITFKGYSSLPTDEPLRIDFSYAQLRAWDERRYYKHAASCYGGREIGRPLEGCYKRPEDAAAWTARNGEFLRTPSADFYRLIKQLRQLALKHARPYVAP